jgi:hypothetical protein
VEVVLAIVNQVVQVDMQKDIILPVRHKLWLWVLEVLVLDIMPQPVWEGLAVLVHL